MLAAREVFRLRSRPRFSQLQMFLLLLLINLALVVPPLMMLQEPSVGANPSPLRFVSYAAVILGQLIEIVRLGYRE